MEHLAQLISRITGHSVACVKGQNPHNYHNLHGCKPIKTRHTK